MNPAAYSVLLVEDETSIREGIRDIIPWDKLGYRFAGEARDGADALTLYDELKPDLIITDIHMPRIDGLAMVKSIREQGDDVKVVILTGFDEFSYARTALQLNVSDYLLKPVSPTELTEMLEKVKIDLDTRSRSAKPVGEESRTLLRRMMMLKIVSGVNDSGVIESFLSGDSEIREASWFQVVLYDPDQTLRSIGPDDFRDRFRSLNPPEIKSELIPDNSGMLIEILYGDSDRFEGAALSDVISRKRLLISEIAEEGISTGTGIAVDNIVEVKQSYDTAGLNLSKRFVGGGETDYRPENGEDMGLPDMNSEPILLFLKSVETGTYDEWHDLFSRIVDELTENRSSEEHCREIITLAVSAMLNALRKRHLYNELGDVRDSSIIKKMSTYKTLKSLHRWLSEIISGIAGELTEKREDSSFAMAEGARKYIESHYTESDLSLEEVCSHMGVSVSTFCRVFKTYHDMTFSTYLTETRIRKAKSLIKNTDLRNKQIAYQVGFNSPHYFSHVFTKSVGYSPTAYRKNLAIKAAGRSGGSL